MLLILHMRLFHLETKLTFFKLWKWGYHHAFAWVEKGKILYHIIFHFYQVQVSLITKWKIKNWRIKTCSLPWACKYRDFPISISITVTFLSEMLSHVPVYRTDSTEWLLFCFLLPFRGLSHSWCMFISSVRAVHTVIRKCRNIVAWCLFHIIHRWQWSCVAKAKAISLLLHLNSANLSQGWVMELGWICPYNMGQTQATKKCQYDVI